MNVRRIALYHLVRSQQGLRVSARGNGNAAVLSPTTTYIICTNPRSGSWLLSDGLAATSLAGRPREWFNPLGEQRRRAAWGLDNPTEAPYAAYLDQVRTRSTTSNGISGIKLHWYQFLELQKKLAAVEGFHGLSSGEMMLKAFPGIKYLWLTRRDKPRQAISYLLAEKTGQWWMTEDVEPNKSEEATTELEFEPEAAACLEQRFTSNDIAWQCYFHDGNIAPFVLNYEDLAADYRGAVISVLKWLGVAEADIVDVPPSRFKQQSDARSEDWLRRYMAFKTGKSNAAQCAE